MLCKPKIYVFGKNVLHLVYDFGKKYLQFNIKNLCKLL